MNNLKKTLVFGLVSAAAVLSTNAYAADLSGWAVKEYQAANSAGLCSYSVVSQNMTQSITRQEFCELAVNLYKKLTKDTDLIVPATSPFEDTDNLAVAQAYCYGLVSGTSETTFTPNRLVTREEMAKMLISTLTASEAAFNLSDGTDTAAIDCFADGSNVSEWAKASVITTLNYSLMNGVNATSFAPTGATTREQAIASINRSYAKFGDVTGYELAAPVILLPEANAQIEAGSFELRWTETYNAKQYVYIIKDSNGNYVESDKTTANSVTINSSKMVGGNDYSVTVGAILSDGSECFSMPIDFKYKESENQRALQQLMEERLAQAAAERAQATQQVQQAQQSEAKKAEVQAQQPTYAASNPKGQALIDTAAKYLGIPYVWGGTTPSGFDCSGFVQYVCKENGISIARVADDQLKKSGVSVSKSELQPGDLVFFGSDGYANHVGMYVGDGTMIHSPSTGKSIMYTSIESDYYKTRYIGAKRVF